MFFIKSDQFLSNPIIALENKSKTLLLKVISFDSTQGDIPEYRFPNPQTLFFRTFAAKDQPIQKVMQKQQEKEDYSFWTR